MKYDVVGLAAPQIGLSWQLFAIEMTEDSVNEVHPYLQKTYNLKPCPLTYFINPKLEIINPEEDIMFETCASINCYHAEVPRPLEVEVKALNRFGEPFCWREKGWLARVVHHEMDHLKVSTFSLNILFYYISYKITYYVKLRTLFDSADISKEETVKEKCHSGFQFSQIVTTFSGNACTTFYRFVVHCSLTSSRQ